MGERGTEVWHFGCWRWDGGVGEGRGGEGSLYRALVRMLEVRTLLLYSMSSVMFYDLA